MLLSFVKRQLSRVFIPVAWSIVLLVLLCLPGSVLPDENKFRIPQFDKLVHLGLFSSFVFVWCGWLRSRPGALRRRLWLFFSLFLIGCAFGIAMEFVQKYWIPNRDFSEGDIIADLIGAGLGYGMSNLFLLLD